MFKAQLFCMQLFLFVTICQIQAMEPIYNGLRNRKHKYQAVPEKTVIVEGADYHYDPDGAYGFAWPTTEEFASKVPLVTEDIPKPILID